MKIALINGSHRQGNTEFMLRTVHDEIKSHDPSHLLTLINLRQKNVGPATQVDYSCKETSGCNECCRDDMGEIYSLLEDSDLIIFGSPIYFSNVSGRMKDLIDRCHGYYFNKKLSGKQVLVIGVGATEGNQEFFASWKAFASTIGLKIEDTFYAKGDTADFVKNDVKTVELLKEFTRKSIEQCGKQL